jgi:hypothetical protein
MLFVFDKLCAFKLKNLIQNPIFWENIVIKKKTFVGVTLPIFFCILMKFHANKKGIVLGNNLIF